MLKPQDFVYDLPGELIAQQPTERRDACRLMHLERRSGDIRDHVFGDLPDLLRPGDLLVLNDTRVIPAKFVARRPSGGRVEGLFLHQLSHGTWSVLLNSAGRCKGGEALTLSEDYRLVLQSSQGRGQWVVRPDPPAPAMEVLERVGLTPLPPYIRRPGPIDDPQDRLFYQTVFARVPGAVAAPTAGMHFTDELLSALADRGVEQTRITLHVGLGTFAPVKAGTLGEHKMHSEWYDLPAQAAEAIRKARADGGRIVAVGTTVVRALASAAVRPGPLVPHSGWTDIFIYPPADFPLTDALITNFHLPKSTLVMLTAAFCRPGGLAGREMILSAYRRAIESRYRFYSYGDAMLID